MKKTIAIISVSFLLSSCAVLDTLKLSKFDQNEYRSVVDLRSFAQTVVPYCDEEFFDYDYVLQLNYFSLNMFNYVQFLPNNDDTIEMVRALHELVQQFKAKYDTEEFVSHNYCRLKLQQIERSARKIQKAIGGKNR
tara:strand:- start:325 stop:732 length:408 start_codon:yes stop_codon:yes gene_type:complete